MHSRGTIFRLPNLEYLSSLRRSINEHRERDAAVLDAIASSVYDGRYEERCFYGEFLTKAENELVGFDVKDGLFERRDSVKILDVVPDLWRELAVPTAVVKDTRCAGQVDVDSFLARGEACEERGDCAEVVGVRSV